MLGLIKSYSVKLNDLLIEVLFINEQHGKSYPQAHTLN